MRLIDADAMIGYINRQREYLRPDIYPQDAIGDAAYRVCAEFVECLPSELPERKKGEWLPAFNGCLTGGTYWFECSKCGRIVPDIKAGGWNFCPNCGANMRGEPNDE